ncbi:UNVERIFIED_CONTAM: hypothetical protein RMT77_003421 [Armadillidium vulgare]
MGLTFNPRAFCSLSGILKIFEITLAIICLILLRQYRLDFGGNERIFSSNDDNYDRFLVGVVALGSSVLIATPLLVGYVFFDTASSLLEALFCFTAAVMNVAGGALCIEYYHEFSHESERIKATLGMASLMIINALVFLLDAGTGTLRSTK